MANQRTVDPVALKRYYSVAFPFTQLWRLFSYGSDAEGSKREFAWAQSDMGHPQQQHYRRYLSYSNAGEFREATLKSVPDRIEIGAKFSVKVLHVV
jgi:DNA primase catalytic subunit